MSEVTKQEVNNLNIVQDLVQSVKKGEKTVETFMAGLNPDQVDGNVVTAGLEAKILTGNGAFGRNQFLEAFNKSRQRALGLSGEKYEKFAVQTLNDEEKQVLKEEAEKFSQTSNDTGAGLTQITSLVETNLLPVMDKYFYNTPLMQAATVLPDGSDKVDVRDITNDRTGEAQNETDTLTQADDTVVVDTLDPRKVRIANSKNITWLLEELGDPTTAGAMVGRMERAINRKIEDLVIGAAATDTDGAEQFYAIFNSKAASGTNRGSNAVTLLDAGPVDHISAINFLLGSLPLHSMEEVRNQTVAMNWVTFATKVNLVRDANNLPIPLNTISNGGNIMIMEEIANDVVLVGDLSNVVLKFLRRPRFRTRIVDDNYIRLIYDTYGDGTIRFAYKNTATKNGFRHGTLLADYTT